MEKNYKEMSTNDIKLYQKTLSDEYEAIKNKIAALCDKLNILDREYTAANNELENRRK